MCAIATIECGCASKIIQKTEPYFESFVVRVIEQEKERKKEEIVYFNGENANGDKI
jgi:hypothetical protein